MIRGARDITAMAPVPLGGSRIETSVPAPRPLVNPVMVGLMLAAILCLKLMAIRSFRVDSDETQHAHVVWGWATGRLQYRDVFDNHMPLFHMLCAPYFALFGEYSDILLPLRLAMLPIYGVCLWSLFRLGEELFSRTAGWCACILAALIPAFFYPSTEFRPDDLWAALWFLTLLVAISGRFTFRRAFKVGILLGLTAAVSTKTVFLGAALCVAAAFAFVLRVWSGSGRLGARRVLLSLLAIGCGAVIFPGAIAIYFAAKGSFGIFFYCVFQHNIVPGLKRWGNISHTCWVFPMALPFIAAYAVYIFRQAQAVDLGIRRVLILTTPFLYEALMYSYCPDLSRQDDLPYVPLLTLTVIPLVLSLARHWPERSVQKGFLTYLFPALVLAEILWTWNAYDLHGKGLRRVVTQINVVLRLTGKGDYVMDAKSDYIFRDRPYYWALEPVTRARIRLGLIQDNIPECLEKTATKVSYLYPTYPGTDSAKFIAANYLPFDPRLPEIGVAGKVIGKPAQGATCTFIVSIPASYAVESEVGETKGTLDDVAYTKAVRLEPGPHRFLRSGGGGRIAIILSAATEEGFHPLYDRSEQLIKLMSKPHPAGD